MKPLLAAILTTLCSHAAGAQDISGALDALSGTLRVYHEPAMSNGQLDGCQLLFEVLQRDWTYRAGGFIRVSGHVAIMAMGSPPRIGTTLKVVVNEVSLKDLSVYPQAPTRAYIIGPDHTTSTKSLVSSSKSDTPGGLFSIFQLEPTINYIFSALETHKLVIAFDKGGGRSDIRMVVETDVATTADSGDRHRSPDAELEFLNCVTALTRK